MASRQHRKLRGAREEKRIGRDQERIGAHLDQLRKGRIDVANGAGIQDVDLLPGAAGGGLNVIQLNFGLKLKSGVHESSSRRGMGPQLTQQLQPLRLHLGDKRAGSRNVAARTMQAGHEASPNRVGASHEDDRYGRGRRLGRQGRYVATDCNDDGHMLTHEIGGEPRQSVVLTLSPTRVEGEVLTFDKACFIETLADDRNERHVNSRRTAAEQSDHRKRTLLRARRERPRGSAAEQRDERAALIKKTRSHGTIAKRRCFIPAFSFPRFDSIPGVILAKYSPKFPTALRGLLAKPLLKQDR